MSPHMLGSTASGSTPTLVGSEPSLPHGHRPWSLIETREPPSLFTTPYFFSQTVPIKPTANVDSQQQPTFRRPGSLPNSAPLSLQALLMTLRPKTITGDTGTINVNGFKLTKSFVDGEEAHGERRKNANSITAGNMKRAFLLDASKRYTLNCMRLAYADILYGWGLLTQRAELLKFVSPMNGSGNLDRRYDEIGMSVVALLFWIQLMVYF